MDPKKRIMKGGEMHISGTIPFMQYKHDPDRTKKPHKDNSEADFKSVLDEEMRKMESTNRQK